MKITIENFNYKGHHFNYYEGEFPQVEDFDDLAQERIVDYVVEALDKIIEKES